MGDSAIEWTDKTWNPTVGCTRVSEGCRNCYAFSLHDMRHAAHKAGKKLAPQYAKPFKELQLMPDRLTDPLHWRKPARVFVNSVSDLFHEEVPDYFIARVFAVMESCPQHTFQVLTKRAERMQRLLSHDSFPMYVRKQGCDWLRPTHYREQGPHWRNNIWLGVSCEDQATAGERAPLLMRTPAVIRFLSCEPLLGPLDLDGCVFNRDRAIRKAMNGPAAYNWDQADSIIAPVVDWVIVGGESGPGARGCDIAWIRSLVEQCRAASVPCFVKQLGSQPYIDHSPEPAASIARKHGVGPLVAEFIGLQDRKGGDPAEWPADLRIRQFPGAEVARA